MVSLMDAFKSTYYFARYFLSKKLFFTFYAREEIKTHSLINDRTSFLSGQEKISPFAGQNLDYDWIFIPLAVECAKSIPPFVVAQSHPTAFGNAIHRLDFLKREKKQDNSCVALA